MLKEELVKLKTARLAKEKGFPQDERFFNTEYMEEDDSFVGFPTQSMLQKWLREEHSIWVMVEFSDYYLRCRVIKKYKPFSNPTFTGEHSEVHERAYEKALEEGLQEALNLIK